MSFFFKKKKEKEKEKENASHAWPINYVWYNHHKKN